MAYKTRAFAPRTKIFFPPADDRMAERISKMLGTMTDKELVAVSAQLSARETPRPLIAASDLMFLEKEGKYLMLSTTYPVKLDRLRSWVDYEDPVKREQPIVSPVKIADDEEDVSKSTARKKTTKRSHSAEDNPVPKTNEASAAKEKGDPVSPEECKSDNAAPPPDDQLESDIQQDDYWSRLNRDFSREADDDK